MEGLVMTTSGPNNVKPWTPQRAALWVSIVVAVVLTTFTIMALGIFPGNPGEAGVGPAVSVPSTK